MVKINNILRLPFDQIPGPKPIPIIYNIWRYLPLIGDYKLDTLFENAEYNKARYGPIVREQITAKHTILHLFDPKDIEALVRQDGRCPYRRSHRALLKYRKERPMLYRDGGLFPENGSYWYRQRNQFQKRMLSKSQLSRNSQKLDRVSLQTIEKLREVYESTKDGQIDRFDSILYRWALASSMSLFLDIDFFSLEEEIVESVLKNLHETLTAIDKTEIQTEKWVKNPSKCPHYQSLIASQGFLYNFVSDAIDNSMNTNSYAKKSYLFDWLTLDKLDKRDVITFIIDALLAGLHTTSYTAAFLLYQLAINQTSQDSVRREVDKYLSQDELTTSNSIDKLTMLKYCLKETMRLNPVSIGTGRLIQDNLVLNSYEIPKGTMVITQNQVASLDANIYTEPNKFKPDRWAHYRSCPRHEKPSPFATLPFGFGARLCIGQRIAEFQIKLLAARLLQNFQVASFEKINVKTTLIHNIKGKLSLRLNKRL